jgi:hypothetical protein
MVMHIFVMTYVHIVSLLFIYVGLLVHQRIPAYTHTHAWFQFASLSLSLANALNDPGSSGKITVNQLS